MQNRLWLVFVAILVIFCTYRIFTSQKETLPKGQYLNFEATIVREPVSADKSQIIYIKDLRIYTNLYPKYKVGDRIRVSGQVDDNGGMFNANVEKIGSKPLAFGFVGELRQRILLNILQQHYYA